MFFHTISDECLNVLKDVKKEGEQDMRKCNRIIAFILVLVISLSSVLVQTFALDRGEIKGTEYRYVVADTDLADWLENDNGYALTSKSSFLTYDTEMLNAETEYTKKLCNKIASGEVEVYNPEEYIRKKASESHFDISEEKINQLVEKVNSYNYSEVKGNKNDYTYAYNKKTYHNNGDMVSLDTEYWGSLDNFITVGEFCGNYDNYDNINYRLGEWRYGDNNGFHITDDNLEKFPDNYFNDNNELIVYVLMMPSYITSYNSFNNIKRYYYRDNDGYNVVYDTRCDAIMEPYDSFSFRKLSKSEQKQVLEENISKLSLYSNLYSKYLKIVDTGDSYGYIDTRDYHSVFEDYNYPLEEIIGLSFEKLKLVKNVGYKYEYEELNNKDIIVENNIIKTVPLAFGDIQVDNIAVIFKNAYTHKINFIDTNGDPIDINFKDYQYYNKFGENSNNENALLVNVDEAQNSSQDDFMVSSIIWNNESNSFYNSKGELLKQETENIPTEPMFNMLQNSFDVTLSKSLLDNLSGYAFLEIRQDGQKIDYNEITKNDKEYYHFNQNITKGITTTDIVLKSLDTTVSVRYLDENDNPISDDITINGKVGSEYQTEAKDIYGYELIETPTNAAGTMTADQITVNYKYRLKNAKVVVKYLDEAGKEISESKEIAGKVFDKYESEAKNIDGYELIETPTNAAGTMTEDQITVNYKYHLKDARVIVNYLDEAGKEISKQKEIAGKVFDKYESEAKDIYGYKLIETPTNAIGIMTAEPITISYVYRLKDSKVITRYLDKDGNEIADTKVTTGKVFDKYTTEEKEIDGYILAEEPTNAIGIMTEVDTEVTYIYNKELKPESNPGQEPGSGPKQEPEQETTIVKEEPSKQIKTGDDLLLPVLITFIAALTLCLIFIINKKKEKNVNKK